MPVTIFDYPKALLLIELEIASLKKELADMELAKEKIEAISALSASEKKFKTESSRQDFLKALNFQDVRYEKFLKDIIDKKLELDKQKALHAVRRREFRTLETEYQTSGMQVHPNCYEE